MFKKNDILSSDFLDFEIFAPSDQNTPQQGDPQSNQFTSLVVYQSEAEGDDLAAFLSTILSAAKLDMSKDVFLLKTTAKSEFSFIQTKANSAVEKILIFGIRPQSLGINLDLKLYKPLLFQNCTFLLAHPLGEIQSDVNKKRALWSSLQEIYLK